ncbi:MAG: hypothetical protein ACREVV_17820 [Steroidobacteraceae bacterium]
MLHQRIDPLNRVGRTDDLVLGTQDEKESMPWVREPVFLDQPGNGGCQCIGLQTERGRRLLAGEIGTAADELSVDELI